MALLETRGTLRSVRSRERAERYARRCCLLRSIFISATVVETNTYRGGHADPAEPNPLLRVALTTAARRRDLQDSGFRICNVLTRD